MELDVSLRNQMKALNLILALYLCTQAFGQNIPREIIDEAIEKWSFYEGGNPIDGKSKEAIRIINELDEGNQIIFMLRIKSIADEIKIRNGFSKDVSDREDVWPILNTSISLDSLEKVQMYFNDDDKYYNINYIKFNDNGINWINGISSNNTEYLSQFHFIHLLKIKNEVFFRFKFRDSADVNFSFSLNGSTTAINKVVDLSNFSFDETGTTVDVTFDSIVGTLSLFDAIAELLNDSELLLVRLNRTEKELQDLIYGYISEALGGYGFTYIRFKPKKSGFEYKLEVTNLNDEQLLLIDLNTFKKETE
jgi:hypothetical protein